MMNSEKPLDFQQKLNPLLVGLPDHLKDPQNYDKIRKAIYETLVSACSHSTVLDMQTCKKCTKKMYERRLLLRKLGFQNPAQYRKWVEVHEEIKERYPNVDWSKDYVKL